MRLSEKERERELFENVDGLQSGANENGDANESVAAILLKMSRSGSV